MKFKYLILLLLVIIGRHATAQLPDIVALEYFFDSDPGYGNGTPVAVSPDSITEITFDADFGNLPDGYHNLMVRVKDENENWSIVYADDVFKFTVPEATTLESLPSIVAMEYFFDADPGVGNGVDIPISSGDLTEVTFDADFGNLPDGYHNLMVRVKDENGSWSIVYADDVFKFTVPEVTTLEPLPLIIAMEYFFDADPGYGNGTPVAVSPDSLIELTFNADFGSLPDGYHNLMVRVKDENDNWSIVYADDVFKFTVPEATALDPLPNIVAMEYFFDADPGFGSGVNVPITPGVLSEVTFDADFGNLPDGYHNLMVRVKDENDNWSIVYADDVFKFTVPEATALDPLPNIVAMEYFFDADPGFGSGVNVPITPGVLSEVTFDADFGNLPDGYHNLMVRVKDETGNWGIVYADDVFKFTVPEVTTLEPLPLIIAMEYFFDADPGFGNGVDVQIISGVLSEITFDADFGSLPDGYHNLMVRIKDETGNWGIVYADDVFKFTVPEVTTLEPLPLIIAMEYFFDADPGFGNGVDVPITPGVLSEVTFDADFGTLPDGYHNLMVRIKDENGKWSDVYADDVFKFTVPEATELTTLPNIVGMEYYFDEDPGFGNGISLEIPFGTNSDYTFTPEYSTLNSIGEHLLCVRVNDELGHWSLLFADTITLTMLAAFEVSNAVPKIGDVIQFTDISAPAETIISWEWDFGDGETSTEQNPAHSYQDVGMYDITLTVSDGVLSHTTITENYITVITGLPEMVLSTNSVEFGTLETDPNADTTIFVQLKNTGTGALVLDSLFGLAAPFAVDTTLTGFKTLSGFEIESGDSLLLPLTLNRNYAVGDYWDTLLISNNTTPTMNLDSGLVAYYPFNGNANDESENGHNGTVNGATLTTDRFGNENSAYDFDGINDYISIGDKLDFGINEYTISTWINSPNYDQSAKIINKGQTGAGTPIESGYSIRFLNSQLEVPIPELRFSYIDDNQIVGAVSIPSNNLPANSFSLITAVLVRNSGNSIELELYVNGSLVDENTFNIGSSNTNIPLSFGALHRGSYGSTSEFFNGKIDNIRIYNRALSEAEIQALFNEGNRASKSIAQVEVHANLIDPTPELTINPPSINFGTVTLGEGANADLTLSNTGGAELIIDSISSVNPFFAMYSGTIIPGASQTVQVSFTPQAAIFYSENLIIHTNLGDIEGDFDVPLTGTGEQPESSWQFSLTNHNFGWVDIEAGAVQNMTVTNNGSQGLQISAAMFGDEVFEISPANFTLTSGQAQTVAISFNPTNIAWYGGTIQFTSDAGTQDIILEGKGYYASSPPQLTFVEEDPYNGTSGISPEVGPPGTYFEYKVLYSDADNDAPMNTYPKVGIDFNGDGDFLDPGESRANISEVDPMDVNFVDGKEYSFITTLPVNSLLGYQFFAYDALGNPAQGEAAAYKSGPVVSDDQLDLAIYANDINFSNGNPDVGEEIAIYATIRNTSDYPAENVPVNVYIMDELVYETTFAAIAPQSTAGISFNHIFAVPEYYPVKVVIDEADSIAEDNELNNFAIRPVVVGEFQVPGAIAATSYLNGSTAYPYGTLRFYGHANYVNTKFRNSNVSGAQVVMTINETGATYIGYTNANGDYNIYFTVPGNLGSYTVSAEVTDFTLSATTASHGFSVIPVVDPDDPPPVEPTYLADLVIRNWNIGWSGNPVINTPNTISASFSNAGNLDAFNIWLYAYVDNVLTDSSYYPTLAQGSSHSFSMSTEFATTGNHSVYFIVDPNHLVAESNESNNTAAKSRYFYVSEPDLKPVDLWFTDNSPLGGQEFGIMAKVKNLNWAASTATTASFYLDETTLLGTVPLSAISGGSTRTISLFGQSISMPGGHVIKIVVDPANAVDESNEANQTLTKNIIVEQPTAELSVSGITASSYNPTSGDPMNFMLTVSNSGSAEAGNFYVNFTMDGEDLGERILVNGLGINETTTIVSQLWMMEDSVHQICANADDENLVPELNEYNNESCLTLGIDLQPRLTAFYPGNSPGMRLNILMGQTVELKSRIYNNGPFRAYEPEISYKMNGEILETDIVPYVNGNIYAQSQVLHTFTQTGYFTVQVVADADNLLDEINEGNNTAMLYIRVYEDLPDLEILSQHIAPSEINPELYEEVDVTATWFNKGNVPANPFQVLLYADDEQVGTFDADTLQSGEEASAIWPDIFSSGETGTHEFRVELDSANLIEELNETNNTATRAIIVGDAPDLLFSWANGIVPSNLYPELNEVIQINATVKNCGGTTGAAMLNIYSIYLSDTLFINQFEISVSPNDSTEVTDFWQCNIPFGYLYSEISGSWPPEFNVDNNSYMLKIGIEPPAIITDPASQDLCEGETLFMQVVATGTNLEYQWFKDDEILAGENLQDLNLGQAELVEAGVYFCKVFNAKDTAISTSAIVSLTPEMIFDLQTADVWICETETFEPQLSVENYSSILWTSEGDGTFSDVEIINPIYYPGSDDISGVDVDICVTATPIAPCDDVVFACVQLLIQKEPIALAGDDATICEDATHQLSGMVYNSVDFVWSMAGDGTFDDAQDLEAVYTPGSADIADGGVALSLFAEPATPCLVADEDMMMLNIQWLPIADAGGDAIICENQDYPIPATAFNFSSVLWETSGDGTFDDSTLVNPVYHPGTNDIAVKTLDLTLTAEPISPCALADVSPMTLEIQWLPTAFAGQDNTICQDLDYQILDALATEFSSVLWSGGNGDFDNPALINPTYTPDVSDYGTIQTLTFTVQPINPCALVAVDALDLYIQKHPTAFAGQDNTICQDSDYLILDAVATEYSSSMWSGGNGDFDNPEILNPTYTPDILDYGTTLTLTLTVQPINPCTLVAVDALDLYIQKHPTAFAGQDNTICQDSDYLISDAEATEYSSVLWSGGNGDFDNPEILNPTYTPDILDYGTTLTLTLTVQPINPCTLVAVDEMDLYIQKHPTAFAGQDNTICQDSDYQILDATATEFSSLMWSGGNGDFDNTAFLNPTYTPDVSDFGTTVTLTLTVQPINPCTLVAVDTLDLYIQKHPTAFAGQDNTICQDADYLISDATATEYSSLMWSGGNGGFDNPEIINPTYTPDVSDYGTTVTLTLTVQPINPCTLVAVDTLDLYIQKHPTTFAGQDNTICQDADYLISDATATEYSSLMWSGGNGGFDNPEIINPTYTPDVSDYGTTVILTLTVQPINPCTYIAVDALDLYIQKHPTAFAGQDNTICQDSDYLILDATATEYSSVLWSGGNGDFDNPEIVNPTYTPDVSDYGTTVTLTLTVQPINPCTLAAVDALELYIQKHPTAFAGQDNTICQDFDYHIVDALATEYSSVLWSGGNGDFDNPEILNPTYTPDILDYGTTLTLTLTVQPINPCTLVAVDEMDLYIQKHPTAFAGQDNTICQDSDYQILDATATEFSSLMWSGGNGDFDNTAFLNPTYTPDVSDFGTTVTLTLTVQPINPCTLVAVDTLDLYIQKHPTAFAGQDNMICQDLNYQILDALATEFSSVLWSGGNGDFDNPEIVNPTYTPDVSDYGTSVILTLTVQPINPCTLVTVDEMDLYIQKHPTAFAGQDNMICQDSDYLISDAEATEYSSVLWSGGNGDFDNAAFINPTYTPDVSDYGTTVILTLTVQPINPCTLVAVDALELFIQKHPTAFAGQDNMICQDLNYQILDALATEFSSVLWSGGNGDFDNPEIVNPTYTPDVSDYGTSVTLTLTVQPINPCTLVAVDTLDLYIQKHPTAFAGQDNTICQDADYLISDATATEYSSVLWSGGNGDFDNAAFINPTYTPDVSDYGTTVILTLTVQPINPCTLVAVDTLELYIQKHPTTFAGQDNTICQDADYLISDATATEYSSLMWSGGNGGFDNPEIVNPTYTPDVSDYGTTLTLTLTVQPINPCTLVAVDALELYIQKHPTAFAGQDNMICQDLDYQILDALATEYSSVMWSGGNGDFDNPEIINPTYTPDVSDYGTTVILTLTVQPINPCTYIAVDALDLYIQKHPTAFAGQDNTICQDESLPIFGQIENAASAWWETSGDGTFDNFQDLETKYHPGNLDLQNGGAQLSLVAQAVNPCSVAAVDLLELSVDHCQELTISQGWSGISTFVQPHNPALESIFAEVMDELIILQTETAMFWPSQNVNTIGNWNRNESYKIKVNEEINLHFAGSWSGDNNLLLAAGWNLIPVLSDGAVDVVELFENTDLIIVKEVAGWRVYWPGLGINTLEYLEPGKAYFVLMENEGEIEFPETGLKTSFSRTHQESEALENLDVATTTITHTIAFPAGLNLESGTQITAFDAEGKCTGSAVCHSQEVALTIFGDDPLTAEKDGATEGELLLFKITNMSGGTQQTLNVSWNTNLPHADGLFHENGLSAVKAVNLTGTGEQWALDEVQIFPNPAHDKVTIISHWLSGAGIAIINQLGETCLEANASGMRTTLNISGLKPGLYLISITCENKNVVKKLVVE